MNLPLTLTILLLTTTAYAGIDFSGSPSGKDMVFIEKNIATLSSAKSADMSQRMFAKFLDTIWVKVDNMSDDKMKEKLKRLKDKIDEVRQANDAENYTIRAEKVEELGAEYRRVIRRGSLMRVSYTREVE